MPRLTKIYGLDTSIFIRLLTGHPESDFKKTVSALKKLQDVDPATELVVSNQVIGEAYVILQHHYEISKADARTAILHLFSNGSLAPLNGQSVINIFKKEGGAGLIDRLIAQEYTYRNTRTLTNDKRMAKLEGVELLK